ncbi:MAG: twin-arginine translocase subunit TatC [Gammaproteobacteria bacterium]
MNDETPEPGAQREQTLIEHLLELRDRLLRTVIVVLLLFLGLLPFANDIYHALAKPLLDVMPAGTSMIATGVASSFIAPMKLTAWLALFIAVPYVLWQVWAFVAPGLYRHEKRFAAPVLVSSVLLFYGGMAFAYFVVFPLVFAFFTATAPEGVAVMTDIEQYLSFVLTLFLAFGIAFETPVVVVLLVAMNMVSTQAMVAARPYIIVAAFVIGMLLTPPDILSQFLMAIPMWMLFEVGLLVGRLIEKRRAANDAAA